MAGTTVADAGHLVQRLEPARVDIEQRETKKI